MLAAALIGIGAAQATGSPACDLLSDDEAVLALNGNPTRRDGGPAEDGYSDCAWSRKSSNVVLSVLLWDASASAKKPAEERYDDIVAGLKRGRRAAQPLADRGDKAVLVSESAAGLEAYSIVALKGGQVLEVIARGMPKPAALKAFDAALGRVQVTTAEMRPSVPVGEAEEPPASAPETPPEAAEPAPPAAPETPPAPAEPPPAKPPSPPKQAEAAPSPACAVLTAAELKQAGAVEAKALDGGPELEGESRCAWQGEGAAVAIAATLLRGQAISGAAETADAYFSALASTTPAAEPLTGLGDRAYLETRGEGEQATYGLAVLASGQIVLLNVAGLGREAALSLGRAAAKRLVAG